MAAHGKSGLGTTLSWDGNLVSDLTKIGGVEISVDTQDVTTLDSIMKEFIAGMPDPGGIDIEGYFYPADTGQIALKNSVGGGLKNVIITLPAVFATTWTFTALCTKFSTGEADKDGIVPFSASLKISGLPVLGITVSTGLTTFELSGSAVLNPAASGAVRNYIATVLTGVASLTVTPTAAAGVITVTANGVSQVVTSGQASTTINLGAAGSITLIQIDVVEDGKMPAIYKINVSRP